MTRRAARLCALTLAVAGSVGTVAAVLSPPFDGSLVFPLSAVGGILGLVRLARQDVQADHPGDDRPDARKGDRPQ